MSHDLIPKGSHSKGKSQRVFQGNSPLFQRNPKLVNYKLDGGFKYSLFSPQTLGEMIPNLTGSIFFRWVVQTNYQPDPMMGSSES